jgi:3'-phosphoadenosine 5'-phosphosulfate sulfotransferase (PAPS reductase)/FAD synthetase
MSKPEHVASISGGKDSAAMSLWLTEQGIEHRRVFADTGWEHPWTYEYIRGPLQEKIGPIDIVKPERGFVELCRHKGMFPSRMGRFCTHELKLRPLARYMSQFDGEVINCVGIRRGESRARSLLEEREELQPLFGDRADRRMVTIWRPLIAWPEADVIEAHLRHGLPPNPLYLKGSKRVGCWPCIFAGKTDIKLVSELSPWRIDEIRQLETDVQEAARKRYAARGETFESLGYHPPTMFAHRSEGMLDIDEMVKWAKTVHGGKQYPLIVDEPEEPHCMKWGQCA